MANTGTTLRKAACAARRCRISTGCATCITRSRAAALNTRQTVPATSISENPSTARGGNPAGARDAYMRTPSIVQIWTTKSICSSAIAAASSGGMNP